MERVDLKMAKVWKKSPVQKLAQRIANLRQTSYDRGYNFGRKAENMNPTPHWMNTRWK